MVFDYEDLAYRQKIAQSDTGIYYVVRYPRSWKLFPLQEQSFGDQMHIQMWRNIVAPDLASAWAATIGVTNADLTQSLLPLHHAFPRGRIEKAAELEFAIYHGNDLSATGISTDQIIRAFSLIGQKVNWIFDPHEQCEIAHRDIIKQILRIPDDWLAM